MQSRHEHNYPKRSDFIGLSPDKRLKLFNDENPMDDYPNGIRYFIVC